MDILSNVELVALDIRKWSAHKKLTEEDLGLAKGTLPPEQLATLGSIKLVDGTALDKFEAIKKRAFRSCSAVGTRFIAGCWAVPNPRVRELSDILSALKEEYEAALVDLLANYASAIDEQAKRFPAYAHLVRAKAPPAATIQGAISFGFQTFRVSEGQAPESLVAEVGGLADTLAKEIEQEAKLIWASSFEGKAQCGQRALNPLKGLLDKLRSFAWLNPSVSSMASQLETLLVGLPKTGSLVGADFDTVSSFVLLMMSGRLAQHAVGLAQASVAAPAPAAAVTKPAASPVPPAAKPVPAPRSTTKPTFVQSEAFV